MTALSTELLVLFLLLFASGLFAVAEIAVIASRKGKLKQMTEEGDKRAQAVLAIVQDPARFLSAVRFAIIFFSVVAGVFVGAALTENFSIRLEQLPFIAAYAHPLARTSIIIGVTLGLIVIGELVPKRISLTNPERVASFIAPLVDRLALPFSPAATFLSFVSDKALKLVGAHGKAKESSVSEAEVNILVEQGLHAGVFNKAETDMVAGVLELDQLPVTALMTQRPKIVFLSLDDPDDANWRKIVTSGHSYFPVYQGTRDHVLGMVAVKALWAHSAIGLPTSLKNLLVAPLIVPETMSAIQLLESFKKSGKHTALVADEFGAIQGLVSLIDVLEAIVGDMPAQGHRESPATKQREDGSWLIDATLPIGEFKSLLSLEKLPHEDSADFQTLGGFIVTHVGRIPAAGDYFEHAGWRFEVVDMDRHRVDKVLVAKAPLPARQKTTV